MIAGATRGAGGAALGQHLARADHNEEVRPGESRGLTAVGIEAQVDELTLMGSHARTATPLYHVHADPPAGRPWSADERARYWALFEREFGLEGRPFASVIHTKNGREHEHRAYLRIHPDGTAIRLDHDHARREKISRVMEWERGEPFTRGAHNRAVIAALQTERPEVAAAMLAAGLDQGPRPRAAQTPQERHQAERTQVRKGDVAAAVSAAWTSADGGAAFAAALRDRGLVLAMGDRAAVVVDRTGGTHEVRRMLAMAARAEGGEAPRAAEVKDRLAGLALPTVEEARAIPREAPAVPEHAPQPVPDPPGPPSPGGGEPAVVAASRDAPSPPMPAEGPAALPQDGAALPAAARAPSPAEGGGGGGASPGAEAPRPGPSLSDAGPGPGEPPGPGAHPDEIARYREKVAAHADRLASAWAAWVRSQAQEQRKAAPGGAGGGGDVLVDEKVIREAATAFIRSIEDAAERRAHTAAVLSALATFRAQPARDDEAPGRGPEDGREGAPPADPDGGRGSVSGPGHAGGDATASGGRRPAGDDGAHERLRADSRQSAGDEAGNRRAPTRLEAALEQARLDSAASVADPSALRAEMARHRPDPLAGLTGGDRKARLDELNRELRSEFREARRGDFAEAVARERMRAHPLAAALRAARGHMADEDRAPMWAEIREAHARLVAELRAEQQASARAAFRHFLEARAATDPRAAAVWPEVRAADEQAARIAAALAEGERRAAELRASEPVGERDPERAARAARSALYDPMRAAQERTRKAEERLAATPLPRGFWHAVGLPTAAAREREAAERALSEAREAERRVTPHYLDIDSAEVKAKNAAALVAREHARWAAGAGAELACLDTDLPRIRAALDRGDWRVREAMAGPDGLRAAMEEMRRRDEMEERRQAEEERRARMGHGPAARGQVVEFPAAGPRMR